MPFTEQGRIALECLVHKKYSFIQLEAMFACRSMYIKSRIKNALDDVVIGKEMKVLNEKYLLQQMVSLVFTRAFFVFFFIVRYIINLCC